MTDNDIIKALECCIGNTNCGECPMFRTPNCMNKVFNYALDLINRQREEIERLKDYNENLQTANTALSNEILEIKSKAIKEFAEELKNCFAISGDYLDIINIIDNL